MIEKITKFLILLALVMPPFIRADFLFFPFSSGKVLFFRFFLFLAFLGWVILMLRNREFRPRVNILTIALILFLVGMLVVSFTGVSIMRSLFSNFERYDGTIQFSFFVLYFLMLISVFRSKKDWRILVGSFLLTALIISVHSWISQGEQTRLSGLFGNPSYLGAFLLIAIGFSAVGLEESFRDFSDFLGRKYVKVGLIVLILFFLITLFYTGTRGCYAGLAAAFGLIVVFSMFFFRENRKAVISLVSVIIILISFLSLIFVFSNHPFIRSHSNLKRIAELKNPTEISSVKERLSVWNIAIKGFKDKPIFGWGPENFEAVFNKYYDYKVGLSEPWFDKAHNQFLEVLATGGVFLFSLYLFLIFSVFYLIFKISKQKKLLAIILASTYFGYLVQGMFLFDTLHLYLALFPFLAFVSSEYERTYKETSSFKDKESRKGDVSVFSRCLVGVVVLVVVSLIYTTVWLPYEANALALSSLVAMREGDFKGAKEFFEKAVDYDTPFSFVPVRIRVSWDFFSGLTLIEEGASPEKIKPSLKELYHLFTSELEKVRVRYPYNSRMYYLLGALYNLGSEKLGMNDLDKAEDVFKQSLNYSDKRTDYYNEYAKALMAKKEYERAEELVKEYLKRTGREDPTILFTLGNINYRKGNYELTIEYYEKAREQGYDFLEMEGAYSRYLLSAQEIGDYQKIVDIAMAYLKKNRDILRGDKLANTYYNIALGYMKTGKNEKAKEYFYKALEIKEDYKKYKSIFDNL